MERYDEAVSASQLGDDLQLYDSNGPDQTVPVVDPSLWLTAMCVHQGKLHVAWVEVEYALAPYQYTCEIHNEGTSTKFYMRFAEEGTRPTMGGGPLGDTSIARGAAQDAVTTDGGFTYGTGGDGMMEADLSPGWVYGGVTIGEESALLGPDDLPLATDHSYKFNGTNGRVVVDTVGMGGGSHVTLECWVKASNTSQTAKYITRSSAGPCEIGISGGVNVFTLKHGSTTTTLSSPNPPPTTSFMHIVATYDGSFMRLYEDGVEVASVAASGVVPSGFRHYVGSGGSSLWFNGWIDEPYVADFNPYTADTVARHYAAGRHESYSWLARGPFVKRWDDPGWTQLGGECEPDLTPLDVRYPLRRDVPVGTLYLPFHPKIVSDGTDLYVGYQVHRTDVAPNQPPSGTFPDPNPNWSPVETRIRKWTGSSWDLYGRIEAVADVTDWSPQPEAHAGGRFALAASPAEAGVVYASIQEMGIKSSFDYYATGDWPFIGLFGGVVHYEPYEARFSVVRFDGSDTVGVTQDVLAVSYALDAARSDVARFAAEDGFLASHALSNETGVGYIFWHAGGSSSLVSEGVRMTRWSDLVDLQTLALSKYHAYYAPLAVALQGGVFYIATSQADNSIGTNCKSKTLEVPQDGSAAIAPLDGDVLTTSGVAASLGGKPFAVLLADAANGLLEDGAENLWGFSSGQCEASGRTIWLYHRPCLDWTLEQSYPTAPRERMFEEPSGARIGNTLYRAGGFIDTPTSDIRIIVEQMPICRGCRNCGRSEGVYLPPRILA